MTKKYLNVAEVCQEEMLHLALASNTLYALGKNPILYDERYIPTFPSNILYTPIEMNLREGSRKNIETFVKVRTLLRHLSDRVISTCHTPTDWGTCHWNSWSRGIRWCPDRLQKYRRILWSRQKPFDFFVFHSHCLLTSANRARWARILDSKRSSQSNLRRWRYLVY